MKDDFKSISIRLFKSIEKYTILYFLNNLYINIKQSYDNIKFILNLRSGEDGSMD